MFPFRSSSSHRPRPLRHRAARVAIAATLLALAYLGGLMLTGNFHAVVPNEFYRSAQPDAADLDHAAALGVRTVINLRGAKPGAPWYEAEVAEARKLGITLVDFHMSARHPLSQERAAELLALMLAAEKPLLVHCRAGADRTGLATALYLAGTGRGEEAAEFQMTPVYGHIPLPILPEYAMDDTFEALEAWLGFPNS